jgi:hypothetical protein
VNQLAHWRANLPQSLVKINGLGCLW